jgi:hypothetical protein
VTLAGYIVLTTPTLLPEQKTAFAALILNGMRPAVAPQPPQTAPQQPAVPVAQAASPAQTPNAAPIPSTDTANTGANALRHGSYKAAEQSATSAIQSGTLSRDDLALAYVMRAQAYRSEGNLRGAADDVRRALAMSPSDSDALALQRQLDARPTPVRLPAVGDPAFAFVAPAGWTLKYDQQNDAQLMAIDLSSLLIVSMITGQAVVSMPTTVLAARILKVLGASPYSKTSLGTIAGHPGDAFYSEKVIKGTHLNIKVVIAKLDAAHAVVTAVMTKDNLLAAQTAALDALLASVRLTVASKFIESGHAAGPIWLHCVPDHFDVSLRDSAVHDSPKSLNPADDITLSFRPGDKAIYLYDEKTRSLSRGWTMSVGMPKGVNYFIDENFDRASDKMDISSYPKYLGIVSSGKLDSEISPDKVSNVYSSRIDFLTWPPQTFTSLDKLRNVKNVGHFDYYSQLAIDRQTSLFTFVALFKNSVRGNGTVVHPGPKVYKMYGASGGCKLISPLPISQPPQKH